MADESRNTARCHGRHIRNTTESDNSQYTVIQKYSSRLDTFVNYYYYWVRNKATVPSNSVVTRKNSTAFVKNLIENPQRSQFKYYSCQTPTNCY